MSLSLAPYVVQRYVELSYELQELWSTVQSAKLPDFKLTGNLAHAVSEAYSHRSALTMTPQPFDLFLERHEEVILVLERLNDLLADASKLSREAGTKLALELLPHDPEVTKLELDGFRMAIRQIGNTHTAIQKHLESTAKRIQDHTKTLCGYNNLPIRDYDALSSARNDYFVRPAPPELRAYITLAEAKSEQISEFSRERAAKAGVQFQRTVYDVEEEKALDALIRDELLTVILDPKERSADVR